MRKQFESLRRAAAGKVDALLVCSHDRLPPNKTEF